jgi:hypothetical protein
LASDYLYQIIAVATARTPVQAHDAAGFVAGVPDLAINSSALQY